MKNFKINRSTLNPVNGLIALILSAGLLGSSAFAQQSATSSMSVAATSQVSLAQGLDIYVDGKLAVSGALAYSNNILTLDGHGFHTVTVFKHGDTAATAAPLSSSAHFNTASSQVVHLVVGGTYEAILY
ncbi:hypothetical protein [Deinococcus ruber]|uniref:DUF4397 domain-containing protein n=1 Tax=Deinococcus ruber TaxID=1848197 RepID=A0A918CEB3_9DEIO|nr:hypothetical protein [Deinococcus ruber]GGR17869.1 hypothetical protein GCM10008957_33270 [Deinococcus ruber]